jgi:hypothetical protein
MTKEIKHQICGDGYIQWNHEGPNKKPLDAFGELIKEVAKPTIIPEELAKYVAALAQGTHEITEVTIRPKSTWVGLNEREVDDCYDSVMFDSEITPSRFRIYQAIEAKLKELNT